MAGRYQGYHLFRDVDGESRRSVEVFWEHNGWFWRPRFKGRPADGEAVGPFTTSTQAYESAKRSAVPPTTQYRPITPRPNFDAPWWPRMGPITGLYAGDKSAFTIHCYRNMLATNFAA